MSKFMNKVDDYDNEVARGFIKAYGKDLVFVNDDLSSIILKDLPIQKKVACVGICDGGHMPAFAGYVSKGMLDGCCVGKTFKSPSCKNIYDTVKRVDMGKGILLFPLIWNIDIKNEVDNAVSQLAKENIDVTIVEIRDDCMQPKNNPALRLTSSGIYLACRIASKAALEGKSKDYILKLMDQVNKNMRTAANVGGSFYLPNSNIPYMKIESGKMQVGVGLHGEEGFEMIDFPSAYLTAEHLFRHRINKELNIQPGDDFILLINDLGSSTIDEMLIIYQEEVHQFELKGANVIKSFIGRYITTLEMDGVSITALRVDEKTKKYFLDDDDLKTH